MLLYNIQIEIEIQSGRCIIMMMIITVNYIQYTNVEYQYVPQHYDY